MSKARPQLFLRYARHFLLALGTSTAASSLPPAATPVNPASNLQPADSPCVREPSIDKPATFTLLGVTSPAIVAESVFLYTKGLSDAFTVVYFLDGKELRRESQAPFWLGGQRNGVPLGYSVRLMAEGNHRVSAIASSPNGEQYRSNELALHVISSINGQLSDALSVYANQISAQTATVSSTLERSSTAGAKLSSAETRARCEVLSMYKNWGIDPTLDNDNDSSSILAALAPGRWSPSSAGADDSPLSLRLSRDAPFYQAISAEWPRVAIPGGYIQHVQLSTPYGGDGIGYGEAVAQPSDTPLPVQSQWYGNERTRKRFSFRMPRDWSRHLPTQGAGDSHMIFVDPQTSSFTSTYKTSIDPETGGPRALYASSPTPLSSLGDRGGSNATNIAELPLLVQPTEATDPNRAIRHAIGGAVGRTWAARVYPASAWDANVRGSESPCGHGGFMNTGLVPYGGVLQLDPALDLNSLQLSLPARRILEAMQTYGYYVLDFGCADLDIYTAVPESEFEAYGGLWGFNKKGRGVQVEIDEVITRNILYVIAPLMKKQ